MRLLVAGLVVVVVLVLFNLEQLKGLTVRGSSSSGATGTSPQEARQMGTPGIKLQPGTAGQ